MAAVLDLIQRFTRSVGFTTPATAVNNSGDDVQQIVELFNEAGQELSGRRDWQALTFEASFTTVAAESQGRLADLGVDMRKIVNDTIYNRTTQQKVFGPLSKQQWQRNKTYISTGPYPQYRIRGNQIIFNPVPPAGQSCFFEYVSKCWASDVSGATTLTSVRDDTDLVLLDEEILKAGLKWRWLRAKRLSYAEEFASYEALVADAMDGDGTKPTLVMDDESYRYRGIQVPEGSWNV